MKVWVKDALVTQLSKHICWECVSERKGKVPEGIQLGQKKNMNIILHADNVVLMIKKMEYISQFIFEITLEKWHSVINILWESTVWVKTKF